jgi:RHS repeat-associated protein
LDSETGLQYNRTRYYESFAGRWMSQDHLGFVARDYNFYRYVSNNATGHIDPFGLAQEDVPESSLEFHIEKGTKAADMHITLMGVNDTFIRYCFADGVTTVNRGLCDVRVESVPNSLHPRSDFTNSHDSQSRFPYGYMDVSQKSSIPGIAIYTIDVAIQYINKFPANRASATWRDVWGDRLMIIGSYPTLQTRTAHWVRLAAGFTGVFAAFTPWIVVKSGYVIESAGITVSVSQIGPLTPIAPKLGGAE